MFNILEDIEAHICALFNRLLPINIYLRRASIKIHVLVDIFSLIINSKAELRTVLRICACSPLKNPDIPSCFHIEYTAPVTVLGGLDPSFEPED